ncbi:MAG: hypothetical protein RLZZ301_1590 [Bacteroidota bacterium]
MKFRKPILLLLILGSVIFNSTFAAVLLWTVPSGNESSNKVTLTNRSHVKKQSVSSYLLTEIQESEEEEFDDFDVQLPDLLCTPNGYFFNFRTPNALEFVYRYKPILSSSKHPLFIKFRNIRL